MSIIVNPEEIYIEEVLVDDETKVSNERGIIFRRTILYRGHSLVFRIPDLEMTMSSKLGLKSIIVRFGEEHKPLTDVLIRIEAHLSKYFTKRRYSFVRRDYNKKLFMEVVVSDKYLDLTKEEGESFRGTVTLVMKFIQNRERISRIVYYIDRIEENILNNRYSLLQ